MKDAIDIYTYASSKYINVFNYEVFSLNEAYMENFLNEVENSEEVEINDEFSIINKIISLDEIIPDELKIFDNGEDKEYKKMLTCLIIENSILYFNTDSEIDEDFIDEFISSLENGLYMLNVFSKEQITKEYFTNIISNNILIIFFKAIIDKIESIVNLNNYFVFGGWLKPENLIFDIEYKFDILYIEFKN